MKTCEHEKCKYIRRRNKLIILFFWDTGARVSEVAGVRICDIEKGKPRGVFHETYTKRAKSRDFKLDGEVHKELLSFIS